MPIGIELTADRKHALFVPSRKSLETDWAFPLAEIFSNLGFVLGTMDPQDDLPMEKILEVNQTGLIILDINLWEDQQHDRLHVLVGRNKLEKVLLWYCPPDSARVLGSIPEDKLRSLYFFGHDTTRRSLIPLLQLALGASVGSHEWYLAEVNLANAALDSCHEGVLVMNPDNFIVQVNSTALRILGQGMGAVLYHFKDQFYSISKLSSDQPHLLSSSNVLMQLQDGRELKVSYREVRTQVANGWPMVIVYFQDVSKELETLENMDIARREAQKAAKTKSDFLANISHELRTPLNSILGMTDLALQLAEKKEQEEYLRILQISGNSLLQLITSMLDYIKLDSGVINLKERAFPLNELFDSISAQFSVQCHNKGLGFHIVADEHVPVFYIGDETRLKQILLNLVSNAFKFTARGEIVIRFRELPLPEMVAPAAESQHYSAGELTEPVLLEFQVVDTGLGISKSLQDEIFQPFVQLNVSDQTNTPGTGIGLTITKLLVEAMGGSISVVSEPGRGAIFTFTCQLMRGAIRKQHEFSPSFWHLKTIIAVGDSWGWFDSIHASLKNTQSTIMFCRHPSDLEAALSKVDPQDVLLFFQGSYNETEAVFSLLGKPQYGAIVHRKHLLSLRLSSDAEHAWHSAPFPYKAVYEPLRGSTLLKFLIDMELELNKGDRDAAYGQHRTPYDLDLFYVEDEGLNRIATSRVLSEAGHHVTAFGDGMQLIQGLEQGKPDFFLMDIEIPFISGYELATRIRRGEFGEQLCNIPIVALTAHDTMDEKHQAEQVGIDAFLAKPFSPQTLLVVIDRVWERFLEGKTGRTRFKEKKSGVLDQVREQIVAEQWENAQNLVQDYRENHKGKLTKEVNELTFRLLLQIRRKSLGSAVEIIDKLQHTASKGVEYEDPRR